MVMTNIEIIKRYRVKRLREIFRMLKLMRISERDKKKRR